MCSNRAVVGSLCYKNHRAGELCRIAKKTSGHTLPVELISPAVFNRVSALSDLTKIQVFDAKGTAMPSR